MYEQIFNNFRWYRYKKNIKSIFRQAIIIQSMMLICFMFNDFPHNPSPVMGAFNNVVISTLFSIHYGTFDDLSFMNLTVDKLFLVCFKSLLNRFAVAAWPHTEPNEMCSEINVEHLSKREPAFHTVRFIKIFKIFSKSFWNLDRP